jgi:hypothetical protein
MLDSTREQPPVRQQKAQVMNLAPSASPTTSASPKPRMGITPPSPTGIVQTDGIRKSPIGKLDVSTIDFVGGNF